MYIGVYSKKKCVQADSGGYYCILPSCVPSLYSVVSHFGLCCCLHSNLWEPVQGANRQLANLSVCVFRAEDIAQSERLIGKGWIVCCYIWSGVYGLQNQWPFMHAAPAFIYVLHLLSSVFHSGCSLFSSPLPLSSPPTSFTNIMDPFFYYLYPFRCFIYQFIPCPSFLPSFPTNPFFPVVDPPAALGLGSMFAHNSEDQEQKLADPYATVSAFGHRCRTETIQNSRYPIWNERLNFPLKVYPIYSSLHNIMFHLVTCTCMSFL